MQTKIKSNKFEGVKIMLSIKKEISEQNSKNPDRILPNLLAIRKKYNLQSADRKKLPLS